jgi:hypothetical protein
VQLLPNAGVQAMTPLRVVTPGGDGILPLRMVQAGTGERVAIVLYVIGEELFGMPDLHEEAVPRGDVVWDFGTSTTNYGELRRQALARNLGFSYLTTFADRGFFAKQYASPGGARLGVSFGANVADDFAEVYFGQAQANDGRGNSAPCQAITGALGSDLLVREGAGSNELDASSFACGTYTDIAAAMVGMHPSRVWTGRLELDLPREALSMDCVVSPAPSQVAVSQFIQATKRTGLPAGCEEPVFDSRISPAPPTREAAWAAAAAVLCSLLLRRRTQRVRPS